MDLVDETNLKIDMSRAKQDIEFLKVENIQLWQAYIQISGSYAALNGLIIRVADEAKMDVDEILDTLEKNKKKEVKKLTALIKSSYPDFPGVLEV